MRVLEDCQATAREPAGGDPLRKDPVKPTLRSGQAPQIAAINQLGRRYAIFGLLVPFVFVTPSIDDLEYDPIRVGTWPIGDTGDSVQLIWIISTARCIQLFYSGQVPGGMHS